MNITIAGVRLRPGGKVYSFDTAGLTVRRGDHVIVETNQGIAFGQVAKTPHTMDESAVSAHIRPIVRIANDKDEADYAALKRREKDAYAIFDEKARANHLNMKLVSVEFTFDRRKAIFYFTADGRIDFRRLVRELASEFHTRIELRQIGVRDEVKMFHTLGMCGRETCCSQWMSGFHPVSIKMAKEQGMSLNSTKISGVCGRLLCCLTYEDEFYHEVTRRMPKIGNWVTTPEGEGQVYRLNVLEEKVVVRMQTDDDETEIKTFNLDEIVRSGEKHVLANNRRQQQKRLEKEKEEKTAEPRQGQRDKKKRDTRRADGQGGKRRGGSHHKNNRRRRPRGKRPAQQGKDAPKNGEKS